MNDKHAAYAVLVAAAVMILKATDPPRPVAVLLTLPPVAAAVYAVTSHFRFVRRTEGVERTATTEAAAFAFYVVVLSALSYFFLESWADLPRLSMLWVWLYGMAVFGVNSIVISRRMS
ncbi:MAG: putative rane protein [Mycobacterium sp.]|nr:putative rane protein [Mycobacterium sp.]